MRREDETKIVDGLVEEIRKSQTTKDAMAFIESARIKLQKLWERNGTGKKEPDDG